MARVRASLPACVLVCLTAPVLVAQSVVRTADPITRGLKEHDFPRTIKVTDNVYTYEDFHAGDEKFTTTNMFVVTDEGVFVADGQGNPAATKGLVDAIAKVTSKPIKYVAICSDHGDHTAGNASFPGDVTYVVHAASKAILDRSANGWKPPQERTEAISDRKMIALGGEFIGVAFLGRAHTGGDLAVWLPRQKILFLSEIFLNRVFPAMRSAYPSEWLRTLDVAERIDADIYIPGHGFTETGPVSKEGSARITRRSKRSSRRRPACTRRARRWTMRSNRRISVNTRRGRCGSRRARSRFARSTRSWMAS